MNEKLNIQNLIDLFVQKQGVAPKEAEEFVKAFFSLIEEGLERDRYVKIRKWGTFKLIDVESRRSVDVNTGERIEIQEHTKVSFTPDSSLKDLINRPFAHFETVVLNDNTMLEDTPLENGSEDEAEGDADVPVEAEPAVKTEENAVPPIIMPVEESQIVDDTPEPSVPLESVGETQHTEEASVNADTEKEEGNPGEEEQTSSSGLEREFDAQEDKESYPVPRDNSMKYFITLAVLVIAVCGCAIFFIYNPDFFARPVSAPEEPGHTTQNLQPDEVLPADIFALERDSMRTMMDTVRMNLAMPPGVPDVSSESASAKQSQAFTADSSSYEIIGTETIHTLAAGETLTRVALKYYGTKALWPYLVKHNQDVIKNPDNVPSGIAIKIPRLRKKK